jgi:starch synthase
VGGLADTVVDVDTGSDANGFVFAEPSVAAFAATLARALQTYGDQRRWRELQLRGMSQDFSWQGSALAYLRLYEEALRTRAASLSG